MPYDTKLNPRDEAKFQAWAKRQTNSAGGNVLNDLPVYDVRGLFLEKGGRDLGKGHGTDRWKKPTHPTFSDESVYHGKNGKQGGHWDENTFRASQWNIDRAGGPQKFAREFAGQERGTDAGFIVPAPPPKQKAKK